MKTKLFSKAELEALGQDASREIRDYQRDVRKTTDRVAKKSARAGAIYRRGLREPTNEVSNKRNVRKHTGGDPPPNDGEDAGKSCR